MISGIAYHYGQKKLLRGPIYVFGTVNTLEGLDVSFKSSFNKSMERLKQGSNLRFF